MQYFNKFVNIQVKGIIFTLKNSIEIFNILNFPSLIRTGKCLHGTVINYKIFRGPSGSTISFYSYFLFKRNINILLIISYTPLKKTLCSCIIAKLQRSFDCKVCKIRWIIHETIIFNGNFFEKM